VAINHVLEAALELQRFCEAQKYRFCFIGGLAVQRWGEPRLTIDADLTLIAGFENDDAVISSLTKHFQVRRPDAAEFALKTRVLLLSASNSISLDIALGGLPFEERTIERSSLWQIAPETKIKTCSADDLIVHKSFANRELDWLDIRGILIRRIKQLDLDLIFNELRPLLELKEAPEIEDRLRKMIEEEQRS
jgi:hypothetical protein